MKLNICMIIWKRVCNRLIPCRRRRMSTICEISGSFLVVYSYDQKKQNFYRISFETFSHILPSQKTHYDTFSVEPAVPFKYRLLRKRYLKNHFVVHSAVSDLDITTPCHPVPHKITALFVKTAFQTSVFILMALFSHVIHNTTGKPDSLYFGD